MIRFLLNTAAAIVVVAGLSQGAAAQTKLVDTFKDWAAYKHDGEPGSICFALSKPSESDSGDIKRDPVFFYVSAWPKDGVKTEVSVKMGYLVKKGSEAVVKIGADLFKLLTTADKAFVNDPTAELKLIEAMKKGSTMTIEGESEGGKKTKDTYSLIGVTKAIEAVSGNCS